MSQNRRSGSKPAESNETPSSKTARLNDSNENSEMLKKLDELRMELKVEMLKQKEDYLNSKAFQLNINEILGEIRKEMKRNEQKQADFQGMILEKMKKIDEISKELASIPRGFSKNIRQAVLGEWKMVAHENFPGSRREHYTWTFESFSKNLKFWLEDGKLKQTGGGYMEMAEGGERDLQVENNHLKSVLGKSTIDGYIEEGRLHLVQTVHRTVWKRVYEKI